MIRNKTTRASICDLTYVHTGREGGRKRGRDRKTDRHKYRHKYRHTHRRTHRQGERQKGRGKETRPLRSSSPLTSCATRIQCQKRPPAYMRRRHPVSKEIPYARKTDLLVLSTENPTQEHYCQKRPPRQGQEAYWYWHNP